ncbi:flavodoxin FldB [Thalassotalea marina]|uniref:Flavodoxin n=1 Tax=Thalassotalea marina TaxID=1673741 RepID=A0A919BG59_9GAMM|nr:flavodoxin FldB [Thalassotalea marina]GHF85403.1 flavodoxin [Thalassotalea marina]
MKIGLFYGSTTCYTEIAAEKIQQALAAKFQVELHNLKDVNIAECAEYDLLIMGISTWDYGELQEDWESQWADLANVSLEGKIVALYGMGDQIGYTDWFQDALGMLNEVVEQQGAFVIGRWPNQGYDFAQSKALINDNSEFVGLALDEDNQYELSDERITTWCNKILDELSEILEGV